MRYVFFILIAVVSLACGGENVFYPKPKGFQRLTLPEHQYQNLSKDYPYFFEYSKSAEIIKDQTRGAEPYWILVNYPQLNAKIQFTYKPLNGNLKKLDEHVADAYKLASKHQVKATSQVEKVIVLKNGKKAVVIEIDGEVPSHFQFYVTDTSKHYLRGAVYLNAATVSDSLAPVVDYLKKDAMHILETIKWNK